MIFRTAALSLLLLISSGTASATCSPIRFAYPDQHRPPYWLGNGSTVAEPPGASVELVREFTAVAGCPVALMRVPVLRLRTALQSGLADFSPADASSESVAEVAFPRDANGNLDLKRSIPIVVVAFVRAKDNIQRTADPIAYFRDRTVGTTFGASYVEPLRQAGTRIDDGGTGVESNLEKLKLNRIDGFVVSLVAANDMDAFVAQQYGGAIVRMDKPLFKHNIWLAANKNYYDAHRAQVETMWNWLAADGSVRFAALLRKYGNVRPR